MSKFSITRAPAWIYLVICMAGGAAVGFVGKTSGFSREPWAAAGLSAVVLALVTPALVLYWRRLDEAAREAHKFAWYWGGGAGIMVVMVAFTALMAPGGGPAVESALAAYSHKELLGLGMISALLAQTLGYTVAWVGWWIARR